MLLGFPRIFGSKSGENQAKVIASVLATYSIGSDLIGTVTSDNASDNDTCIGNLEILISGLPEGWSIRSRIRCIGHIINLVVEDLLFGDNEQSKHAKSLAAAGEDGQYEVWIQLGLIGRIHNLCIYINQTPERREAFEALQKDASLPIWYVLLVDGGIRWHSTYEMCQRVLKLKDIIIRWQRKYVYYKGVDIRSSFLTNDDFEMLEIWCQILQDFKDLCLSEECNATISTQGTAAGVLKGLTCMYERLQDAEREIRTLNMADRLVKPFIAGLTEASKKTLKYTTLIDETDIYYAAVILDPNFRLLWFEDHWAKYDNRKWYKRAAAGMQRLFDEYSEKYAPLLPSPSQEPSHEPDITESDTTAEQLPYHVRFNRLSAGVKSKKRRVAVKEDDYTRYIKYWDAAAWEPVEDIIEWWNQHQNEFPILSRMAFDILSIPGMSVEVERIFSQAGNLVTASRTGLTDDTIEACQIQHHGLKNGHFSVA